MNRIASPVTRAVQRLVVGLLLGLLVSLVLPAGAASAAAYRYWGYFQWDGSAWQFASKGPDQIRPADGSVEGWRFATATPESTRMPRAEVSFDEVCAATEAEAGKKRVAVVIDYGRAVDYEDGATPPEPVARCASVDEQASGLEVLGAVAEVRTDKSLVCGLDGLPESGCGGEVKEVSAEAQAPDTAVEIDLEGEDDPGTSAVAADDGPGTGTWIGIGVAVLALVGLGAAAALRRREA